MEPSNELKDMAKNATKFSIDELVEWLNVFQSIGIKMGCTNSIELRNRQENKKLDYDGSTIGLIEIEVSLTPEIKDSDEASLLTIYFMHNNKASIASESYTNNAIPDYLLKEAADTFGFEGTWEEVTRKWIVLNEIIVHSVPAVPEDLK